METSSTISTRGRADAVSHGLFLKSGGNRGLVERNLVVCTYDLATGGTVIGISFGGGGTGNQFCAPALNAAVPCSVEHTDGVMRNNLIANCSDVGIYLNRAKNSKVLNNTIVATGAWISGSIRPAVRRRGMCWRRTFDRATTAGSPSGRT